VAPMNVQQNAEKGADARSATRGEGGVVEVGGGAREKKKRGGLRWHMVGQTVGKREARVRGERKK